MKVSHHVGISAVLGYILYWFTRSPAAGASCLAAGILVDCDHLLDYTVNYGLHIRRRHFFESFRDEIFKKIYILLHSWEMVFGLAAAALLWDGQPVLLGLFVGMTTHILLDQVFNEHNPWAYFLAYRLAFRFNAACFYGEEELRRREERAGIAGRRP